MEKSFLKVDDDTLKMHSSINSIKNLSDGL